MAKKLIAVRLEKEHLLMLAALGHELHLDRSEVTRRAIECMYDEQIGMEVSEMIEVLDGQMDISDILGSGGI